MLMETRIPAFSCSILPKSTLDISSSLSNASSIKRRCSNCSFLPKDHGLIRSAIVPVSLYFFSNKHRLVLLIVTPSSARRRWIAFNRIPSHENLMTFQFYAFPMSSCPFFSMKILLSQYSTLNLVHYRIIPQIIRTCN